MVRTLTEFVSRSVSVKVADKTHDVDSVGISKIGGMPDVTEGFEWPHDDVGRPLTFLMQIACADVAKYDETGLFPKDGVLLYFYEMEKMSWDGSGNSFKMIYYDGETALRRVECDVADVSVRCINEISLCFEERVSYPSYEDYVSLCGDVDNADFEQLERDYAAGLESIDDDVRWRANELAVLFGYADLIQNYIVESPSDNVLLMQLNSFKAGGTELMFGDNGRLFVYLTKEALRARRFDEVKVEMQCS